MVTKKDKNQLMPTISDAIAAALESNWKKATEINKSILKENPKNVDALNRLGFAYLSQGEARKAKNAFDKVLKIDPFNPIAIKNIKKIKSKSIKNNNGIIAISPKVFLEEPGITKAVSLINLASKSIIISLLCGQPIQFVIKKNKIEVRTQNNIYIGVLPDDLSFKIKKLINQGNVYEVYIKSVDDLQVTILIREIKRGKKVKDASFVNKTLPDYHSSIRSELLEGVLVEESVDVGASDDSTEEDSDRDEDE